VEYTTGYARSGDLHIAYLIAGAGPFDLVFVPSWISEAEHFWQDPLVSRYFGRLASFSRLIMFDRRGSGRSDPVPRAPTLEEQMDDVVAVMDAVGSDHAAVLAMLEGGAMAALFAASHPERTDALVLHEAQPRMSWAPDYDWAMPEAERELRVQDALETWGDGSRMIALSATAAEQPRLRRWYARLERLAATPSTAARLMRMTGQVDVRAVLPSIQAPTLVIHRAEDEFIDVRHSRYLAEHIPGARLVLLPGREALGFSGGDAAELDEIEEFLTGARHEPDGERILATVMFCDVVDSTRLAAGLGDRRWRTLLDAVTAAVARELGSYRGRAVKTMGDGFLATFDGPARAIRCATSIRSLVHEEFGLEVRTGLHTGEIEVLPGDVGGIAVHIGARVAGLAAPGEVLVSGTVRDLVVGSGIGFADRGEHELKGVPDRWRLWSVAA
jgi:class 3 adenylate cyclase